MRNLAVAFFLILLIGCRLNDDDGAYREVIVEKEVIVEVEKEVTLCDKLAEGGIPRDTTGRVVVYPNPSNGEFTVRLTSIEGGRAAIRLLDISGRTVLCNIYSIRTDNNHIMINADSVASGVYLLQAYFDNRISTLKVIFN